jgi:DNA-binding transcriptional MerR regulator
MTDAGEAVGYLRIGELSRRLGLSPETIRAWERRYSLLSPRRTAGGFRLYDDEDVARLRAMQTHIGSGLAAAEAARLVLEPGTEARPAGLAPSAGAAGDEAAALADALERFDDPAANAVLDRLFGTYSLDVVIDGVLVPFLSRLGERWERSEISVGQEHYASNFVRGRLLGAARGWGRGSGPRAVLACVPGEQHDLGLLCFGVALRDHGWRIDYLGADTPIDTVRDLAARVRPAAVVLVAELTTSARAWVDEARTLAAEARLAVGGRAVDGALASELGAVYLWQPPAAAARSLAS